MHQEDARRFFMEQTQRKFKVFSRQYGPRQRYAAMDAAALQRTLGETSYKDPTHYLASIAAWAAGNRGAVAARRSIVHGLVAQGFARADIERALAMSPDEYDRLRAEVGYTAPDPQPAHQIGPDFPLYDRGRAKYEQIEKERENKNA